MFKRLCLEGMVDLTRGVRDDVIRACKAVRKSGAYCSRILGYYV